MRKVLLLAVLLVAACKTYKADDDQSGSGAPTDAVYQPPPPRQVSGDGSVGAPGSGGTGGTSGAGGTSGTGGVPASPDAAVRKDAPVTPDAPLASPDAPSVGSGDVASVGCVPCDLLAQDCGGPGQNCYPSGAGRGCCQSPEALAGPGGSCFMNTQCDRGSGCVGSPQGSFCYAFCSTATPACAGCKPLTGYAGVGYCAP
jgi:hypothetical protein